MTFRTRGVWLAGCLVALLFGTGVAGAASLTCEDYKDRLNSALLAGGSPAAVGFVLGFANAVRGKRYDWNAGAMEGSMNCGPADQFEEFGIRLQFRDRSTFSETLKQFITIQGASICALASDTPPTCTNFGRRMLQTVLEQVGRDYTRGVKLPSAVVDRPVFPGTTASLASAPTLITFLVGPGLGSSLDAARQPLSPTAPAETLPE